MINTKHMSLAEIIGEAANLQGKDEQVAYLKQHTSPELEWYVDRLYNYDNSHFVIPKFELNKRHHSICYFDLKKAAQYIEIVETLYGQEKFKKAEDKLYMVLTELSADDATLILDMFNGESLIDKGVWVKVFPQFFLIDKTDEADETEATDNPEQTAS